MTHLADSVNRVLEAGAPALYQSLSRLGRESVFPRGIPFQAKEARGCELDGTIGLFTDGGGCAVPVPSLREGLAFDGKDLDRALLYSPVAGIPELRDAWRDWQREEVEEPGTSSRPFVTCGLTHALSTVADLFCEAGRKVVVPSPFWGNYRQVFELRRGAELVAAPSYREDGGYDAESLGRAIDGSPPGEPVVAIVNFPSNPGGYSPTVAEREALRRSLVGAAERRPVVVLSDDAYAGLVYDPEIPSRSFFWDLVGAHPNLVPIKVDGATKEVGFFGGRVGFLTFAVPPGGEVEEALDSKFACLSRATVGSPVATSQILLLRALRSGRIRDEVEAIRDVARERYRALRPALDALSPDLLRPLPFNSGFFSLLEIPEALGVDSETLRRHLIEHHSTGIISIAPRYVRLATCSVRADDLPEMMRRIVRGLEELSA